ncbi:cobalt-precorrin-8 methylmutase [Mangrovibacter phragmitis]|uniref:cobalt-precorrin-8 methylmutase n=1 Tax=Mangrovibacter phragmitis TaxID=1691903 RepID=UPI003511602B
MDYIQQPLLIERRSFEIINEIIAAEHPGWQCSDPRQEAVIKRVIHTTADFDWLETLWFSPHIITVLDAALRRGCTLFTDTTMALAGINKARLARHHVASHCFISNPQVAAVAKEKGITRSMAAVDVALAMPGEKIFVFGNAPTALFRLLESGEQPAAVIGVPVGFVGAAESKQALTDSGLPGIAARGRKGGSNVAAAIVNAVLYTMEAGDD